ncbi:uncharacterized protein LOC100576617 isoform X1 [Apis mellifera]|uniref:Uncharacterized protein LOC100576617 isoform X1 n=1 Tax=Apis mellifera TaxID=7460 RepID=A0A7M7MTB1_APIME|nr:uncharacterized protein LOC100576617 isoform X1 [Apis mellifera]|eukprot:XP_026300586.1 uncharacterized protein LOC100576617 isoform X1 [Apis mellifera]
MPRSCPRSDEETKWQVTRRLTSVEELATDDNGAPETITSSSRLVRRPIRIIDSLLSRRNSQMSNTRRESIFRKYFDQTEDREWARYRRFLPCYFLEISAGSTEFEQALSAGHCPRSVITSGATRVATPSVDRQDTCARDDGWLFRIKEMGRSEIEEESS